MGSWRVSKIRDGNQRLSLVDEVQRAWIDYFEDLYNIDI